MSVVMGVMQLEEEESEDGCERQRAPMVTNVDFRKLCFRLRERRERRTKACFRRRKMRGRLATDRSCISFPFSLIPNTSPIHLRQYLGCSSVAVALAGLETAVFTSAGANSKRAETDPTTSACDL